MFKKPKRPSFQDFYKDQIRWSSVHRKTGDKSQFPCLGCRGFGFEHRHEDNDPVEGYKLAPWYPCSRCDGTGSTSLKIYRAYWRQWYWLPYKKNLAEYRLHQRLLKKARAAFTKQEMAMISKGALSESN